MKEQRNYLIIVASLMIIITFFHYSTQSTIWALHDFYRRLYYLPIILASFRFRLRGGFVTSLIVALIYAPHLLMYFGRINIQVVNQFLETGMFMVVGLITGYLVERDYSKRKLLEHQIVKLTNLENYTHNILSSIGSGVIALDKDMKIKSLNKSVYRIFQGRTDIKGFLKEQNLIEDIKLLLQGNEKPILKQIEITSPKDTVNYFNIGIYPLKNVRGIIEGAVILIDDVTEVKQLELQLRRGERLSAIGQLASGVAHEIRNPLAIIKTISQTIDKTSQDRELREGLEIINHEIERANRVIKGLLDFAKTSKSDFSVIKLQELMENLIVITRTYGQNHGVDTIFNCKENIRVYGDKDKLKQAFINIIFNGIEAMDNGGVLEAGIERRDDWALIFFRDTGRGMDRQTIDRIFNPFFTTKDRGTGLGLSITHNIIEEHGGRIEVTSKKGQGTRFDIYLPAAEGEDMNGQEHIDS